VAVAPQAAPRPRAGGGRLFIILGVVMFLVATGILIALGTFTRGGGNGGTVGGANTKVVYAAKDIPLRTQILSQDQITVKTVPSDLVPGAFTLDSGISDSQAQKAAFSRVQSLIAEVNISAGQPLLQNALAKPGDIVSGAQAAFLPIPEGYVAFTIPTSEQTGVAGNVQPNDYITVLATAGSGKSSATVTIFTQLHVIRVGPANLTVTSSGTTQNNSAQQVANASSLTVVTTACQSELMTWFVSNAQLRYELESFHDYAPAVSGPDATCPSVTKASGITAADIVKKFPSFAQAYGG